MNNPTETTPVPDEFTDEQRAAFEGLAEHYDGENDDAADALRQIAQSDDPDDSDESPSEVRN